MTIFILAIENEEQTAKGNYWSDANHYLGNQHNDRYEKDLKVNEQHFRWRDILQLVMVNRLKMLTWIMFQSQPAACDHVLQDMYFSEGLPYLKPLLLAF